MFVSISKVFQTGLRLCFIAIVLVLSCAINAFAQTDEDTAAAPERVLPTQRQFRISVDLSRPFLNLFSDTKRSYELALDYSLNKEVYAVFEAGFGGSDINYPDLSYTSTNTFLKVGLDRSMVARITPGDWDMVFAGIRYGVAFINRGDATFTTQDNFWGTTTGTVSGTSIVGHWGELTGGVRVELLPKMFVGWSVRGKFLINQGPFRELPPAYVAGFGRGEKSTVFDFNVHLSYALRWDR